jgi:long-chain acyl-CoA synthetase
MGLPSDCTVLDISQHPKTQEIIQAEIDEVNSELAQFENIKKFSIITEEFSTENFLTPSLKIKRKAVIQQYQSLIDEMYLQ